MAAESVVAAASNKPKMLPTCPVATLPNHVGKMPPESQPVFNGNPRLNPVSCAPTPHSSVVPPVDRTLKGSSQQSTVKQQPTQTTQAITHSIATLMHHSAGHTLNKSKGTARNDVRNVPDGPTIDHLSKVRPQAQLPVPSLRPTLSGLNHGSPVNFGGGAALPPAKPVPSKAALQRMMNSAVGHSSMNDQKLFDRDRLYMSPLGSLDHAALFAIQKNLAIQQQVRATQLAAAGQGSVKGQEGWPIRVVAAPSAAGTAGMHGVKVSQPTMNYPTSQSQPDKTLGGQSSIDAKIFQSLIQHQLLMNSGGQMFVQASSSAPSISTPTTGPKTVCRIIPSGPRLSPGFTLANRPLTPVGGVRIATPLPVRPTVVTPRPAAAGVPVLPNQPGGVLVHAKPQTTSLSVPAPISSQGGAPVMCGQVQKHMAPHGIGLHSPVASVTGGKPATPLKRPDDGPLPAESSPQMPIGPSTPRILRKRGHGGDRVSPVFRADSDRVASIISEVAASGGLHRSTPSRSVLDGCGQANQRTGSPVCDSPDSASSSPRKRIRKQDLKASEEAPLTQDRKPVILRNSACFTSLSPSSLKLECTETLGPPSPGSPLSSHANSSSYRRVPVPGVGFNASFKNRDRRRNCDSVSSASTRSRSPTPAAAQENKPHVDTAQLSTAQPDEAQIANGQPEVDLEPPSPAVRIKGPERMSLLADYVVIGRPRAAHFLRQDEVKVKEKRPPATPVQTGQQLPIVELASSLAGSKRLDLDRLEKLFWGINRHAIIEDENYATLQSILHSLLASRSGERTPQDRRHHADSPSPPGASPPAPSHAGPPPRPRDSHAAASTSWNPLANSQHGPTTQSCAARSSEERDLPTDKQPVVSSCSDNNDCGTEDRTTSNGTARAPVAPCSAELGDAAGVRVVVDELAVPPLEVALSWAGAPHSLASLTEMLRTCLTRQSAISAGLRASGTADLYRLIGHRTTAESVVARYCKAKGRKAKRV